jgi:hypothetical protein
MAEKSESCFVGGAGAVSICVSGFRAQDIKKKITQSDERQNVTKL